MGMGMFIWGNGKMMSLKVLEPIFVQINIVMKEFMQEEISKVLVFLSKQMEISMKAIGKMAKRMGWELKFTMIYLNCMKVILKMIRSQGKGSMSLLVETALKENGQMISRMAKELSSIIMETFLSVNGLTI